MIAHIHIPRIAKARQRCCTHWIRQAAASYHELSYKSHGDPFEILQFKQKHVEDEGQEMQNIMNQLRTDQPSLHDNTDAWVRVQMKFSSINPADLNSCEGRYPSPFRTEMEKEHKIATSIQSILQSPYFPSSTVGGSEGIGTVTHVSFPASDIQVGDLVMPSYPGMGTWRSSITAPASFFLKIPLQGTSGDGPSLDSMTAATLSVNPCTAYRLLHDFLDAPLEESEVVIQNGGASAVGFMTSQLASILYGAEVVSIVRRGGRTPEQFQDLCDYLMTSGKAALVFEEETLMESKDAFRYYKQQIQSICGTLPRLALNCVGGESASILLKTLSKSGTMVTYGGMSKKPITVPTGPFIFQDLRLMGFWYSRWVVQHLRQERLDMMERIVDAFLDKSLIPVKSRVFPLSKVQEALKWNVDGDRSAIREKIVFACDDNLS